MEPFHLVLLLDDAAHAAVVLRLVEALREWEGFVIASDGDSGVAFFASSQASDESAELVDGSVQALSFFARSGVGSRFG